ncbi:hypothetical protein JZ751_027971 [Albula glossodonta]|uniref:Uncharacterized protein n=1 Tax=Albula glossodonta TaxID=121402 RepID=A0A8T2PCQ2_9TELE|nr:hypothetical protein JZ751_027971 [Albula glossodonta]
MGSLLSCSGIKGALSKFRLCLTAQTSPGSAQAISCWVLVNQSPAGRRLVHHQPEPATNQRHSLSSKMDGPYQQLKRTLRFEVCPAHFILHFGDAPVHMRQ